MSEQRTNRFNVLLDDEHAAKLHRLVATDVLLVLIVRVADRREVYNPTTIRRLLKQIRDAR